MRPDTAESSLEIVCRAGKSLICGPGKIGRQLKRFESIEFFLPILQAGCDGVVIEPPALPNRVIRILYGSVESDGGSELT